MAKPFKAVRLQLPRFQETWRAAKVEPQPEQEDSFVDAKAEEMSTVEEKLESPCLTLLKTLRSSLRLQVAWEEVMPVLRGDHRQGNLKATSADSFRCPLR